MVISEALFPNPLPTIVITPFLTGENELGLIVLIEEEIFGVLYVNGIVLEMPL